jgi:putative ABC transport system permease protein
VIRQLDRFRHRLRSLFHRHEVEQELQRELQFHLDQLAEEKLGQSTGSDGAKAAAQRSFGNSSVWMEEVRDAWGWASFDRLRQDFAYGLRAFRKQPRFFVSAILILALGVGINLAVFSVVRTVLFDPLPYPDSGQLAVIRHHNPATGTSSGASPAEYLALRNRFDSAVSTSMFLSATEVVHSAEEPYEAELGIVSGNLFETLGVDPILGRGMTLDDADPRTPSVVVLSHKLWLDRFGGDPGVLGSSMRVGNLSHTIIGVLGPDFVFPQIFGSGPRFDFWRPFPEQEGQLRLGASGIELYPIVRLKPGIRHETAQAELATIDARLASQRPQADGVSRLTAIPLRDQIAGNARTLLIMLWGAVGALLLIVCANLANMLLARGAARQQEFAVRAGLGASRWRLMQQTLTESILLAVPGGALGLALAAGLIRVIPQLAFTGLPRLGEIHPAVVVDPLMMIFSLGLTVTTGVLFGIVPAVRISTTAPRNQLQESGRGIEGRRSHFFRAGLVLAQISIALMLLTGAGLLVRSFVILLNAGPGLQAHDLLTFKVVLPRMKYLPSGSVYTRADSYFNRLSDRLSGLPQVQRVSYISALPLSGSSMSLVYRNPERPVASGVQPPSAEYRSVSPGLFETMKVALLAGRDFDARDTAESDRVTIVSETFARLNWPGQDAIGKQIERGGWMEPLNVIGVAPDIAYQKLDEPALPMLYLPLAQDRATTMSVMIRTSAGANNLAAVVRESARAVDPEAIVLDLKPMETLVADAMATRRWTMHVLGCFAGAALFLSIFGIYSVIAYSVTQRTPEIGVRIALGARSADIRKLILKDGIGLAVGGIAVGVAGSITFSSVMTSLLYGIQSTDTITIAGVSALLLTVALLASYVPARRAMRIDPVTALRHK